MEIVIRKPRKTEFCVPFDPKNCGSGNVFLWKDEENQGQFYLLAPSIARQITDEVSQYLLVPCISLAGSRFLWPVKLPESDGSIDSWNDSALKIARKYSGKVVKVKSSRPAQQYVVSYPKSPKTPPEPPADFAKQIREFVQQTAIRSMDDAVIKRILGQD